MFIFVHLHRCAWELQALETVKSQTSAPEKFAGQVDAAWEVVIEKKTFKVWRRPIEGSHLFEYRGQKNRKENAGIFCSGICCTTWL